MRHQALVVKSTVLCLLSVGGYAAAAAAAEPLALGVETLTVPPSTQPLLHVRVKNLQAQPFAGTLSIQGPDGWRLAPASRPVTLAPAETKRIPFTIERGRNVAENAYAFELTVKAPAQTIVQRRTTYVASAPYHAIKADGQPDEWAEAIPVSFLTQDHKTTVSTYWNRKKFSLLVAVQERELVRYRGPEAKAPCDALQFALAALEPSPAAAGPATAQRFEFLVVATGEAAKCFQLASPDTPSSALATSRNLEPCAVADAEVAVGRVGDVTYYECALPVRLFGEELRPSEGAEFYLAALVHDPDATGLRTLSPPEASGDAERARPAWARWAGARFGDAPPQLLKVRWGFCTSQY